MKTEQYEKIKYVTEIIEAKTNNKTIQYYWFGFGDSEWVDLDEDKNAFLGKVLIALTESEGIEELKQKIRVKPEAKETKTCVTEQNEKVKYVAELIEANNNGATIQGGDYNHEWLDLNGNKNSILQVILTGLTACRDVEELKQQIRIKPEIKTKEMMFNVWRESSGDIYIYENKFSASNGRDKLIGQIEVIITDGKLFAAYEVEI